METSWKAGVWLRQVDYTPVSMMVHGKSALPQDKKWPGKHVFNELLIYSHIFFSFKRKVIYGGGQKSMEMAHT